MVLWERLLEIFSEHESALNFWVTKLWKCLLYSMCNFCKLLNYVRDWVGYTDPANPKYVLADVSLDREFKAFRLIFILLLALSTSVFVYFLLLSIFMAFCACFGLGRKRKKTRQALGKKLMLIPTRKGINRIPQK